MRRNFEKSESLAGAVTIPPDKSISHRAAIISSLCRGKSRIEGYSPGTDCRSTLECLDMLGVSRSWEGETLLVEGKGAEGFEQPSGPLDCGNSATTMRLLAGALAGLALDVTLVGDASLAMRPMGRIVEPLSLMGADVSAEGEGQRPPLRMKGGRLSGIEYSTPVPSAQVKSAVLLAALNAKGTATVIEKVMTRDHTERMLEAMGVDVLREGLSVSVNPGEPRPCSIEIPGDFSSAAFVVAAALVCPGSEITLSGVGLNPTRTGFLEVIMRMGADVRVREAVTDSWEPRGEITTRFAPLSATDISGDDVTRAIDEIPLLALLATQASGRTRISDADELRHKESDRITGTVEGLLSMGARVEETPDGMVIDGPCNLTGSVIESRRDHRLAMTFAIAGIAAEGLTTVCDWESTEISYPGFDRVLLGLGAKVAG